VDARPTHGRHQIVTAAPAAGRDRPAATDGRAHRRRRGAPLMVAVAGALVAAACSSSSEAGPDAPGPTFSRASGGDLAVEEPVANLADLVAPPADGAPWTIVGDVYDPDSRAAEATVWTSEDGRGWEPATIDPASEGTGETMAAAVSTEDGLLAVGQVGDGEEGDAAIWRQDAEGEWRREMPEGMGGEHEQWAFDVTVGEGGILVAGGENVWGEVRPRLWFSADGESWSSVDGGAGGPFDETGEESVRSVAPIGAGFVAVGSSQVEAEQDGVAWFSPDGEAWERVDAPSLRGERRQELLTVVATDEGVVAGGYISDGAGQGQPITWRSADGRTWSAPSAPLPAADVRQAASDLAVRSITRSPQGLVAAGGSEARPHLWVSSNGGASWDELPNPVHGEMFQDGIDLLDAEGDGERTVAIGSEPSVLMLAGARWENVGGEGFPTGGAQPFATSVASDGDVAIAAGGRIAAPTADARERFTGQVWRQDGDDWQPVDSELLSAGYVMDAVAYEGGFVAVGFEDFGFADQRSYAGDPGPDGLVWVSENGTEWARIGVKAARINDAWLAYLEDPSPEHAGVITQMEAEAPPESIEPAGGQGTRSLGAVAPLGSGYIAVGSVYDGGNADPVIVVSPDGLQLAGEPPAHSGEGIQRYNDVCVGPDGTAVTVGVTGQSHAFDVAVAARVEGRGWVPAEGSFGGPGDQQGYACAASDDGFIVVGSDDSSGNVNARVWTSEDGRTWTEIESSALGGTGDQWPSAVAPVPDGGWLVGGSDTANGDGDIALWRVTADGDIARRDTGETALAGPGDQTVTNIHVDDDGHVAIAGSDYGRVGLWESDTVDR
jgi:hypothetical protein